MMLLDARVAVLYNDWFKKLDVVILLFCSYLAFW